MQNALKELRDKFNTDDIDEILTEEKYAYARGAYLQCVKHSSHKNKTITQRLDAILLHKIFGIPIFLFFMWILFQATFTLGSIPMDAIDAMFNTLSSFASNTITNETVKSLVIDGVIAGACSVVGFVPNIVILFCGIALLETTGYMSRASFLLDGILNKFGLHGKSFIPLVTGFGCSVPAYMATRMLKNDKDRLLTMFIIGFMSCGAKLPVYVLFISAFFTPQYAGNILFAIYIISAIFGLLVAKILRTTLFGGTDEPFVMEMPRYRLPNLNLLWFVVYSKTAMYLKKASGYILIISMLIWFVGSYPKSDMQNTTHQSNLNAQQKCMALENTYIGMLGKAVEPIFAPLGFDWKMSVATISGLAAKEVIVSTLGVLYAIQDDDNLNTNLSQTLQNSMSFASACAFIVFIMLYIPCIAATVVFSKEAGRKKYTIYLVIFTFSIAWICAFFTYHAVWLIS